LESLGATSQDAVGTAVDLGFVFMTIENKDCSIDIEYS
jgi:hypothetical protein